MLSEHGLELDTKAFWRDTSAIARIAAGPQALSASAWFPDHAKAECTGRRWGIVTARFHRSFATLSCPRLIPLLLCTMALSTS